MFIKVVPEEVTWKKSYFYFDKKTQKNYCACEIAMFYKSSRGYHNQ